MSSWSHRHVLDLAAFSLDDFTTVLSLAQRFRALPVAGARKLPALQGRLMTSLFFEPSTRTRSSFELAAKRLSADVQSFSPSSSSLSKGESLLDTARTYVAMGAIVMAGPSADGYFQARYAGTAPLCLDHGQNAWLQPGDARNVAWGDGLVALVIGEVHGPHGNAIPDGRAISPAPAVIVQTVERVVTIQPSQPKPASTEATARRSRAGNTIRKQTGRGTWAAINLGADGQRFQRQQLTTKLHPQARAALEQLAADAGLRVCEVLEALVLAPGAAAVVGRARPLGVRPAGAEPLATAADRTGERRTRLTKGQAERVDQVLLELLERGRTGKADLERVAAAIAADGLPAQGVSTLRTRLTRLARRQGQGQ